MSITKIAAITGASVSTVARVLRDPEHKCHSMELKERILQTAREIGYVPNEAAKALKSGSAPKTFGCEKVINLSSGQGTPAQSLKVRVPAGIEDGKSIRLRGKGGPGMNGGEAGDLLLKIHVDEKPGYERKGMDVYTTISVPFTTAVFGGEAIVNTLKGSVKCKIPAGIQSGSKIRLRGKGIVSMKDPSVHGDMYAAVQIQVPRNLSPEAKQKLREFEKLVAA